jgi:hypothetical protein
VYVDEDRVAKSLPAVPSARLRYVERRWLADPRGDVLFLGCDAYLDDADVPIAVVDAARRSSLIVSVEIPDGSGRPADLFHLSASDRAP